jgi:hypothetical protein
LGCLGILIQARDNVAELQSYGDPSIDAEITLKRFDKASSNNPEVLSSEPKGNGSSWNELNCLYNVAEKDDSGATAKKLSGALYSLQIHNELLLYKNTSLCGALTTKQKKNKRSM